MSYVNLRCEMGPLMSSIREILEKIWHCTDDWWLMTILHLKNLGWVWVAWNGI